MSPRPKKSGGPDTREKILAAALALFSRHGFSGTSMRQLAREVGVRESALYHHFESKEALFEALFDAYGPGRAQEILADIDLDAALAGGVRGFLNRLMHDLLDDWGKPEGQMLTRLMLTEGLRLRMQGKINPEQYFLKARAKVSAVMSELMRRKLIRKLDPDLLALELVGPMVLVRILFLVIARGAPDLTMARTMADRHVDFFLAGATP